MNVRERLFRLASFIIPPLRLSLCVLFLAGGAAHVLADSWEPRASMQSPRKYFGACAYPGRAEVLAMGGYNNAGTGILATMRKYDPGTEQWTALASMNRARARLSVAAVGANIYAMGGYDSAGQEVSEVEAYNVVTNLWTVQSSMLTPRAGMGCAVVNGLIYTIGGTSGTAYTDIVEIYDPAAKTWSSGPAMPTARAEMGVAAVGTKIYAIFGAVAPRTATSLIEVYDTVAGSWSTLAVYGSNWPKLMRLAALGSTYYLGSYIYVFGGQEGSFTEEEGFIVDGVHKINIGVSPATLQVGIAELPDRARDLGVCLAHVGPPTSRSSRAYVAGGMGADLLRTFIRSTDLSQPSFGWDSTPLPPMAGARAEHGMVSRGGIVYVIGGKADYLDAGEEYDSLTDAWRTRPGLPTSRAGLALGQTATGGMVFAIGGVNRSGDLATNERYDPAARSWSAKSPMPTSRKYLSIAALNDRIYAIGGMQGNAPLSKMEVYNPMADAWTTAAPMPTARFLASAVALNGSIYVAGGVTVRRIGDIPPQDPSEPNAAIVYVDTLEVYDPISDSWTSCPNMPAARLGVAVGSPGNGQLYVLGGAEDGEAVPDNDRYNPDLSMWEVRQPMTAARIGHVAVAPDLSGSIFVIGGESAAYVNLSQQGVWSSSGTILADTEVYQREAAALSLQMSIFPAEVEPGETVSVIGHVKNVSDALILAAGAAVEATTGASLVSPLSLPAGTLTLTPGESTTFVATYTVTGAGLIGFSFTAAGTAAATGAPVTVTAYASPLLISGYRASLEASLDLRPLPLTPGGLLTVTLTMTNTGGGTAYDGSASLTAAVGAELVSLASGPLPSGTVTIAPSESASFTWTYSVSGAGYALFAASGVWQDIVFGPVTVQTARSTQPSAPTGLAATPGTGQVTLAWDPNPPYEDVLYYNVYRRTALGPAVLSGTVSGESFSDAGLANGQIYWYSVAAVNADGAGMLSGEIAISPLMFPASAGDVWISSTGPSPLAANPARGERVQVLLNVPGCGPGGLEQCAGTLKLALYTLLGEEVLVLLNEVAPPGERLVEWTGRNNRGRPVASGGYLLSVEFPDGRRVIRKVAITK